MQSSSPTRPGVPPFLLSVLLLVGVGASSCGEGPVETSPEKSLQVENGSPPLGGEGDVEEPGADAEVPLCGPEVSLLDQIGFITGIDETEPLEERATDALEVGFAADPGFQELMLWISSIQLDPHATSNITRSAQRFVLTSGDEVSVLTYTLRIASAGRTNSWATVVGIENSGGHRIAYGEHHDPWSSRMERVVSHQGTICSEPMLPAPEASTPGCRGTAEYETVEAPLNGAACTACTFLLGAAKSLGCGVGATLVCGAAGIASGGLAGLGCGFVVGALCTIAGDSIQDLVDLEDEIICNWVATTFTSQNPWCVPEVGSCSIQGIINPADDCDRCEKISTCAVGLGCEVVASILCEMLGAGGLFCEQAIGLSCGPAAPPAGEAVCEQLGYCNVIKAGTCMPSTTPSDCESDKCVQYGNFPQYTFCVDPCSWDADCPWGFHCEAEEWACAPNLSETCHGGDVWWQDSCGHHLQVSDNCASLESCVDGNCVSNCTDECSNPKQKTCVGSTSYKECGNFDSDWCWEWGPASACAGGTQCAGEGECLCAAQCGINNCGPNGCGGTCGYCTDNKSCIDGTCVPNVSPVVYVQPISGVKGVVYTQGGYGFSPNTTAELHFERPDGTTYPQPEYEAVDGSGTYIHEYDSITASQFGEYRYWAVDGLTGAMSNVVTFMIYDPATEGYQEGAAYKGGDSSSICRYQGGKCYPIVSEEVYAYFYPNDPDISDYIELPQAEYDPLVLTSPCIIGAPWTSTPKGCIHYDPLMSGVAKYVVIVGTAAQRMTQNAAEICFDPARIVEVPGIVAAGLFDFIDSASDPFYCDPLTTPIETSSCGDCSLSDFYCDPQACTMTVSDCASQCDPDEDCVVGVCLEIYCGDGNCDLGDDELCSNCPADCGICLFILPGEITSPPEGQMVDNLETFQIDWTQGSTSTGTPSSTALYCRINGGPWDLMAGFGYNPPFTYDYHGPGDLVECRVRTRLNNDYDVWEDSPVVSWTSSETYPAMIIESLALTQDPPPNACNDAYVDATITNVGDTAGYWRARGYLHPAGADPTHPDTIDAWWTQYVNLAPNESEIVEFRFDIDSPLPLDSGTWVVTVLVDDYFEGGAGSPDSMTIDIAGQDLAPPEITHFEIYAYEGTPPEVVPGKSHYVLASAEDDYHLETFSLEWREQGGTWAEVPLNFQPEGACEEDEATNAHWVPDETLPADVLLELRFTAVDLAGKSASETVEVFTRATDEPAVTFVAPTGGEVYTKTSQHVEQCMPVTFYVYPGIPITSVQYGFALSDGSRYDVHKTVSGDNLPEDGYFSECVKTIKAGDDIVIYVRVRDENGTDHYFYSNPVTVNFPAPLPPWGTLQVQPTELPLPRPDFLSAGSDVTYSGLQVSGDVVTVVRDDFRHWTDNMATPDTYHAEATLSRLHLNRTGLDVEDVEPILPTTVETEFAHGASANINYLRLRYGYTNFNLSFDLVDPDLCPNKYAGDPCDYDLVFREVRDGAVTPPEVLGTYPNRTAPWYAGSVRDMATGPSGAALLWARHTLDEVLTSQYFRFSGGTWNLIEEYVPHLSHHWVSGGQVQALRAEISGQGAKEWHHVVLDETTGAILSDTEVWTELDEGDYFTWATVDPDTEVTYLVAWNYKTHQLVLFLLEGGVWSQAWDQEVPSEWRGIELQDINFRDLVARNGHLYLFMQLSFSDGYSDVAVKVSPDSPVDLESAFQDIDHDLGTTGIAVDETGRLVRLVEFCNWNFVDRLCIQQAQPVEADCWDGDPCTVDTWDPVAGVCSYPEVECPQDGDLCNGPEVCDPATAECSTDVSMAVGCDDGNVCNGAESCDPATGLCSIVVELVLDDGIGCTLDQCDPLTNEIGHIPQDDWCVVDACHVGECEPASDDADSATGCVATALPVPDDGLACTQDLCDPATGEDLHPVLPDSCLIAGGCYDVGTLNPINPCLQCAVEVAEVWSPSPAGAPCSDGNACTPEDACADGICVGSGQADCEDDNPCTYDWCNPTLGCQSTNTNAPCTDDDPCTVGDICVDGACQSGPVDTCDDGNECTDDSCNPTLGCQQADNAAPCDDGNACTSTDLCTGGACVGNGELDCDDGNPCTDDSCDPVLGCVQVNNDTPCDDGDVCTTEDACVDGACTGTVFDCDDDNPCTVDVCFAQGGVPGCFTQDEEDGLSCADGDPCTSDDVCTSGACGGVPVDCDDENPCTETACQEGECVVTDSLPGCCVETADCAAPDEACDIATNSCFEVACLECIEDADCGAEGNLCVAFASGDYCAVVCDDSGQCGDADQVCDAELTPPQCVPAAGDCECVADDQTQCLDGQVVSVDTCGQAGDVLEDCGGPGCFGEECCPEGTHAMEQGCVPDVIDDPNPPEPPVEGPEPVVESIEQIEPLWEVIDPVDSDWEVIDLEDVAGDNADSLSKEPGPESDGPQSGDSSGGGCAAVPAPPASSGLVWVVVVALLLLAYRRRLA